MRSSSYTSGIYYLRGTYSCGLLNHERSPDGKKYYSLFDGLGSIVGMTDSAGNDVNRYDYDPYGNIISQQEQSGLNNPWKFAAGYLDSSTGLSKFGTRYYDPTLGRWTQLDSAGTGYVYANDDPVNEVDPSGKVTLNCGTANIELSQGVFSGTADLLQSAIGLGSYRSLHRFHNHIWTLLVLYPTTCW
jgi:RHS repeat-associated protein